MVLVVAQPQQNTDVLRVSFSGPNGAFFATSPALSPYPSTLGDTVDAHSPYTTANNTPGTACRGKCGESADFIIRLLSGNFLSAVDLGNLTRGKRSSMRASVSGPVRTRFHRAMLGIRRR